MLHIRVGQVIGGAAYRVVGQLPQGQLGKHNTRHMHRSGGISDGATEFQRLQAADHHRVDGTELLVEVRLPVGFSDVFRPLQRQGLAVLGHQVQLAQGRHGNARQYPVDGQVNGFLGAAVGLRYAAFFNKLHREFPRWQPCGVHLKEYRLAPGMHFRAHGVVPAEFLGLQHGGNESLGDQGQI